MSIQELWEIKKNLSEKFWGKSAEDINNLIKPEVDEMKHKIEKLRSSKTKEHTN